MKTDLKKKSEIAAHAAAGKSNREVARLSGVSDKTVAKVLRDPEVMALVADNQERLAEKYEQLAEAVLDNVTYEDLEKANLQQKAIASATMLDKARLIRGTSTQNIAVLMAQAVIEADKEGRV